MPDCCEVDTDLMRATGVKLNFEECGINSPLENVRHATRSFA